MPDPWNGVLVLHAHGGPALGAPDPKSSVEDLQRCQFVPRAGYAWAGSTFRQGGVAVRSAAEDTERLRRIFDVRSTDRLRIADSQSKCNSS